MKINQLTFTRFVAAMLVFIYHYGRLTFLISAGPNSGVGRFFSKGNVSVSYFFVLSGFILYVVYYNRIKTNENIKLFFKARLIRILPAYFFALFIYMFFCLHYNSNTITLKQFLLNFFLIQSWVPHYEIILNVPAWSLSVEAFFYLVFPFIILFSNNTKRKKIILIFIVIFIITQLAHIYLKTFTSINSFLFYNPVLHLGSFLVGIIFGILFIEKTYTEIIKKYSGIIMIAMLLTFVYLLSFVGFVRLNYHNGLFAPIFGAFILALALNEKGVSKLFSKKPLVFLGEISYGIYIYQYPSLFVADYFEEKMNLHSTVFSFLFHLFCLLLLSSLSFLLLEKPLRVFVNAKQPIRFRKLFNLKLN